MIICEHGLTEFCQCIPRRPPVYVRPHVEMKPGRPEPFKCECKRPDGRPLLRKHRHQSEMECLPQEAIDAWAKRVRCGPRVARSMFWLELEFGR